MRFVTAFLALFAVPVQAQDLVYDFALSEACAATKADVLEKYRCIGEAAGACMEATEGGWSTLGQSACFEAEWQDWDARLNNAYGALIARLKDEDAAMASESWSPPSQAEALRAMQRAWIAYRDASCAYEAAKWTGGTGAGPATVACLAYETGRQTFLLEVDLGEF